MKCYVDNFTYNELKEIVETSSSQNEVVKRLGYRVINGSIWKVVKRKLNERGLDYTSFNHSPPHPKEGYSKDFILLEKMVKDSNSSNCSIKQWIEKFDIKISSGNMSECGECGQGDVWNNKPLVMQLDHINGINNDNRPTNLRLICPHCHSQTETFGSRNKDIKPPNTCSNCSKEIGNTSTQCGSCAAKTFNKSNQKYTITYEELYDLVVTKQTPFNTLARKFGVSDNSIRKRCKVLGIPYKRSEIKRLAGTKELESS